MPFSGKTEAVNIARKIKIPVFRMGDMVWDEVKKRGLKLNDKNVGTIATHMRKKHGKNIWAIKIIKKIKSMEKLNKIVIDGVRNIEEVDTFKRELGKNFNVVAVLSSDKTRHKRALIRNRKDDTKDSKKIVERDQRELGWGLDNVISFADIIVINEGSIDEFKSNIEKIFKML